MYCFDTNYIHVEAMPSRTSYQILLAYQQAYKMIVTQILCPFLQRLDTEVSIALVAFLDSKQIKFQTSPAGIHQRNSAERAICTWKNQFIALLGGTYPNFQMKLWEKLLPRRSSPLTSCGHTASTQHYLPTPKCTVHWDLTGNHLPPWHQSDGQRKA